jgi:tellurite resistance protein TehA-like permease
MRWSCAVEQAACLTRAALAQCSLELEKFTAIWLMPIFPCLIAAASGGAVARKASPGEGVSDWHFHFSMPVPDGNRLPPSHL